MNKESTILSDDQFNSAIEHVKDPNKPFYIEPEFSQDVINSTLEYMRAQSKTQSEIFKSNTNYGIM